MANRGTNGLSPLKQFLKAWLAFTAALFLPYLGIYLMGFQPIEWWRFLFGAMPVAAAVALLLEMDKHEQAESGPAPERDETRASNGNGAHGMSAAELAYTLFARRKSLVALFVLCSAITVLITYHFVSSLVRVEYEGASGMVVNLPGETVYYIPLYPYSSFPGRSWQNTGIGLQKDDEITFEISGMVSPGILENLEDMRGWREKEAKWWDCKAGKGVDCGNEPAQPTIKWPFTGPQGYHAGVVSSPERE
jgi:hypothetical protein